MNTIEAIPLLTEKIRERSLIPFIGAGISKPPPSNLPLTKEFLEKFDFSDLEFESATYVLNHRPNFRQDFHRIFGNSELKPNIIHKLLSLLNSKYYITTNYDRLLESAFKTQHKDNLGVIMREGDLPSVSSKENILIKLHGDIITQDLLVLTKKHYLERLKNPTLVDSYVHCLFATNTILFIGYSLSDDNIFSLLKNQSIIIAPDISEKYIVLPNINTIKRELLDTLNVKPIYLNCANEQITSRLASFLYRLWEQIDFFSSMTRMVEVSKKPSLKEAVERAIALKRENETQKAKEILDDFFESPIDSWEHEISFVSIILWLFVSIYDKLEKWDEIVLIEKMRITSLLKTLKRSLPPDTYYTIYSFYQSNVAIAMLRAMDLMEARYRLEESSKYQPIKASPESLKIKKADNDTIWAIAKYMEYIQNDCLNQTLLHEAIEKLQSAKILFDEVCDDCHHKGRFNGTSAFIETQKSNPNLVKIFEQADRAHNGSNNGKNRTKYGIVAGKYCNAYCHYWAASRDNNETSKIRHLEQAQDLLRSIENDLLESQYIAKTKIYGLMIKILTEFESIDLTEYNRKYEIALNSLNPAYKNKIEIFGLDKWIKTPLN